MGEIKMKKLFIYCLLILGIFLTTSITILYSEDSGLKLLENLIIITKLNKHVSATHHPQIRRYCTLSDIDAFVLEVLSKRKPANSYRRGPSL